MKLDLATIHANLGWPIQNSTNLTLTGATFDSRKATDGTLFVPLVAENDGHNYVDAAIANGATATLWQTDHKQTAPANIPVILVEDTLTAYQELAAFYLKQVAPKVVAVSGSNGKTTTKDFIAAITGQVYRTMKTPANFNNEIGVPTTILNMADDTEILVIELGMDHPGDLTRLSKLVTPDIAVLTMIGEAHIEFFKTRDAIADGKMEIISGFRPDSVLVYNGDEPLLSERVGEQPSLISKTFGLRPENALFASEIELKTESAGFQTSASDVHFTIPLTGRYNISNALAAISVGELLDIPFEQMATALAGASVTANRTEWLAGNFGGRILSDVYNSNPTAAKEVLLQFVQTPTTGHRIVVLGDMLELGEAGPDLHADLADSLNPEQISRVYLVGDIMSSLEDALKDKFPPHHVKRFKTDNKAELTAELTSTLRPDDIILLKGSHGIHLEEVVTGITE